MNSVNGGTTKKGPGCARPYGRTAISAVLQFLHWSFKSAATSAVQKHTLAWNCYKAHCSLSAWDFVWPRCVRVCTWMRVSSRSLFETNSLKSTLSRLSVCVCVCVCRECVWLWQIKLDKRCTCAGTQVMSACWWMLLFFFFLTSPLVKTTVRLSTDRLRYRRGAMALTQTQQELYHMNPCHCVTRASTCMCVQAHSQMYTCKQNKHTYKLLGDMAEL